MTQHLVGIILPAALGAAFLAHAAVAAQPNNPPLRRKPVPDKVVVLTFDDSCASQATVVAPVLKKHGFGGSFYICNFASFTTRKDWYMTWRQMRGLVSDGFEIGNHTRGHAGGSRIGPYLDMEDELLAHGLPKTTTIAWPSYQVNVKTFPELTANGYTFGRGGYSRPYRPEADNPFDIPSFSVTYRTSMEQFVQYVRQACDGRIVVLTFHGVPDFEHPWVTLAPAAFKVMMQYLKDNHYKVIALRDLAEYIDPVQAAKLPPTKRGVKDASSKRLAAEETPIGAVKKPAKPQTNTPTGKKDKVGPKSPPCPSRTPRPTDVVVNVADRKEQTLAKPLTGDATLIKTGEGRLCLSTANTHTGGTIVNDGTLMVIADKGGLGKGPVTLNEGGTLRLERVAGTNPLILNGGTIYAGNGFGDTWDGLITFNGNTKIDSYATFVLNAKAGQMMGPGGFTLIGGTVSLAGANTYTGPTIVRRGTLRILRAVALYNGDPARWPPSHISVHTTARLVILAGGEGEFTGEQLSVLLRNITAKIDRNGLMDRAEFCIDTTNAAETVTITADLADSKGPGGGPLVLRKQGAGSLRLTGKNTWSGRTIIDRGTLSVSSLNRVAGGSPASSLGAPGDIETGGIVLGAGNGRVGLLYTGPGETTDSAIDLAGKKSTVTFDQSGQGLLKLTGEFILSGYGHDKTIVLAGSSAGTGEFASDLRDPYDRAHKARTALTKTGAGTWTVSGTNTYTGPTTVAAGRLTISDKHALGPKTQVTVAAGAKLALNFRGQTQIGGLVLDGKSKPAGTYSAANAPGLIEGTGSLVIR